ncbi:AsnC family transcriptional regulator [Amycolatopsis sp. WAC 01375]|uniref:Lrp/AsnC family transcriptional regulator n=1 Tax=unclassified Amycolatopsis TaxID=2618356 RepID=UPI000F76BFD5|nr:MULTISPECIES: Lrp/AsnC family transcriptional regulator [unclassified Amycolatopsis]RSM53119.1 AsnC family transcriptional regulator [Amycolatopsis sp. WAC 01376]RSM75678.1 AsnC family transcriptional regulator [Amycolatopsis sp. WAC 01375]RSN26145.1 AsnC family transcriptional regulator [Amycolatopsis sp. WAC 01416]
MADQLIDETDREILELLREDARRTLGDIGARVTLSTAAVKRRIDRMQEAGVIVGYTVQIDHAKLGWAIEAFTELRFTGTTKVGEIVRTTTRMPEAQAVFTIAGDPDALVWLRVRDMGHLQQTIDEIRRHHQVTGTKTLMVLDSWTRGQQWPHPGDT